MGGGGGDQAEEPRLPFRPSSPQSNGKLRPGLGGRGVSALQNIVSSTETHFHMPQTAISNVTPLPSGNNVRRSRQHIALPRSFSVARGCHARGPVHRLLCGGAPRECDPIRISNRFRSSGTGRQAHNWASLCRGSHANCRFVVPDFRRRRSPTEIAIPDLGCPLLRGPAPYTTRKTQFRGNVGRARQYNAEARCNAAEPRCRPLRDRGAPLRDRQNAKIPPNPTLLRRCVPYE